MKTFLNFKSYLLTVALLCLCNISWASQTCFNFDLTSHSNDLINPLKTETIKAATSQLPSFMDNVTKFFFDYSDGKNLDFKHAFLDCTETFKNMFRCEGEEYDLTIDFSNKDPKMSFNSLTLTNSDQRLHQLKSKTDKDIVVNGKFIKCPNPLTENEIIGDES